MCRLILYDAYTMQVKTGYQCISLMFYNKNKVVGYKTNFGMIFTYDLSFRQ